VYRIPPTHAMEEPKPYERARELFEQLRIEERALFLVESMASTLVQGVDEASKAFMKDVETFVSKAKEHASSPEAPPSPENDDVRTP
jgi:hypothetical protein